MKKFALRALQFAVTIAILAWIFRDQKLRDGIGSAWRHADPFWIATGVFVSGLGEIANIARWGIFLRVQKIDVRWMRVASLFLIGVFFNSFLPLGATGGDVVKILYLSREHRTRRAAVILSVAADRLVGLIPLILFSLGIVVLRHRWLSQTPVAAALLYFLIVFSACAAAVLIALFVITEFGLAERLPPHLPGRAKLIGLSAAYQLFARAWRASLAALALSLPVLFTYFGTFYCAARAFRAPATLSDIFSIMPVVTIVTSFPISIGGLGVREELFKTLLGDLAGVSGEVAVLISLAGFLIYVVWSVAGAAAYACSRPAFISLAEKKENASLAR